MILTGDQIYHEWLADRITIDNFDRSRLEPNSYGFRLAPDLLRYEDDVVDCYRSTSTQTTSIGEHGLVLWPGEFYLGCTMEAMGSAHYAATLHASRSASTLGIWIQLSAPLGHSGARFSWTLEITVAAPVRVYSGMVIGKLAFWTVQGPTSEYLGRYTGSHSPVASRMALDKKLQ